jgi:signal transduction histidine kinase
MRLHVRLALGTAALLMAASVALSIGITRLAARFEAEVAQRLNAGVAMYVTNELQLVDANGVNHAALRELAHRVMTVNPSAEVYLLDAAGNIVTTLVAPERIRQRRVDLMPIRQFLSGPPQHLIAGTDPTSATRRVAFSVAPLATGKPSRGYLYVVLGGSRFDSVTSALRGSYALQTGLTAGGAILLVALILGVLLFAVLTLPLRGLARKMSAWAARVETSSALPAPLPPPSDEIAALNQQFDSMARHIEQQIEQIRSQDRQRREFIATISHDLRTPLTSLHGYLETVVLKGDSLPRAARQEYLETAIHHSNRLQQLIAALFELSKLEAGVITPAMEPFSIADLIQDIVLRFRLRSQQLGIELSALADPKLPPALGDIALVERIFENLLDNALRHTPPGGRILITADADEGRVRVEVDDTGQGISPRPQPDAAEHHAAFSRTDRQDSRPGLGLAIVRHIVERHGGSLSLHSKAGCGTVVHFDLPFARPAQRAQSIGTQR